MLNVDEVARDLWDVAEVREKWTVLLLAVYKGERASIRQGYRQSVPRARCFDTSVPRCRCLGLAAFEKKPLDPLGAHLAIEHAGARVFRDSSGERPPRKFLVLRCIREEAEKGQCAQHLHR